MSDAMYTAGTQDKVRVLLSGGVHGIAHHLLVDVLGADLACYNLCGQLLCCPHDLRAAAVVDSDVQGHAGLAGRVPFQFIHHLLQLGVQRGAVAQELDADIAVLVIKALDEVLGGQLHDGSHLFQRALPVLGGEGIEI